MNFIKVKPKTNKNIKKINLFFILFIIFIGFINNGYSEEDIYKYDYFKLKINSNISFDVILNNPNIEYFKLYDYFVPFNVNGTQYLNNYSVSFKNLKILKQDENLIFEYDYNLNSLKERNLIKKEFILESEKYQPKINKKVKFPYNNIPKEYKKYLEFGKFIKTNEKIKKKAVELSYGEDDVFVISTKIANWIRYDINYNLSTIFLTPNQTSIEVFETKQGVCREITNLFASMLRSIRIPVRIVNGFAYTNSENIISYIGSNWGSHAWAEVYIGGKWVPFDLTYNQFGFVDATHIITYYGAQEDSTNLKIESRGKGITLTNTLESKNKFKILDKKIIYNPSDFIELNLDGSDKLGFGSYGYLNLKIKNKKNYYQVLNLEIYKPQELISLSKDKELIILRPNEEKNLVYEYKIPTDLNNQFEYTFPLSIFLNSYSKDFEIKSRSDYKILNKTKISFNNYSNIKKEISNNDLKINCLLNINSPKNDLVCSLFNFNNHKISNILISELNSNQSQNINLDMFDNKSIIFNIDKFKSKIILKYNNKSEKFDFDFSEIKPKINLSYKLNPYFNEIYIDYNILNYKKGLILNIYNNKTLVYSTSKEKEKINLNLNEGKNNLIFELKYKNNLIDKLDLEIKGIKKNNINNNIQSKNLGFFESLYIYIKNLFNEIF